MNFNFFHSVAGQDTRDPAVSTAKRFFIKERKSTRGRVSLAHVCALSLAPQLFGERKKALPRSQVCRSGVRGVRVDLVLGEYAVRAISHSLPKTHVARRLWWC